MPNTKKEKCQSVIRDLEVPSSATRVQKHFFLFQSISLELLLGWASCLFSLWDEALVLNQMLFKSYYRLMNYTFIFFSSNSSAHMMGQFWLIKFFYSFHYLLIVD